MKNIIVFYHAECRDGFGAAWAVWKKLGNKAEYIPAYYQTNPPFSKLKNKKIYFVDCCYDRDVMDKIIKIAKKVIVLDHHETRENIIKNISGSVYTTKNSGSVIAWKYFHPEKKVPSMLKYIEDLDFYRFKLPSALNIAISLDSRKETFDSWNKFSKELENPKKRRLIIRDGKLLAEYEGKLVDEILKSAYEVIFEGKRIWVVNAPRKFRSETANRLSKRGSGLGISWFRNGKGIEFSLRSNNKVDTSKLAEKHGGGGHPNASGFKIFSEKFPWKVIK